jgi:large subunit ribosomal protein L28
MRADFIRQLRLAGLNRAMAAVLWPAVNSVAVMVVQRFPAPGPLLCLDAPSRLRLYRPFSRGTLPANGLDNKGFQMSRVCELTGVGPMVGNNVSHSNHKSKRRFLPALRSIRIQSDALGQMFNLRISNAALRTLDFRGGLDVYLVKADNEILSARALKIKKQVKAKLAGAQPAA